MVRMPRIDPVGRQTHARALPKPDVRRNWGARTSAHICRVGPLQSLSKAVAPADRAAFILAKKASTVSSFVSEQDLRRPANCCSTAW